MNDHPNCIICGAKLPRWRYGNKRMCSEACKDKRRNELKRQRRLEAKRARETDPSHTTDAMVEP